MFFALEKEHGEGWFDSILENQGTAYLYEADINCNIADLKHKNIISLFEENNIDIFDYEMGLVENPSAEIILSEDGTNLLLQNGYEGCILNDYDPRDFQKDLESLLIFKPSNCIKNFKLLK